MMDFAIALKDFIWDKILIFLLLGTGLFYSINLKFPQIRHFKRVHTYVFGEALKKGDTEEGSMSSFQSLATAIAAQVGTGNLAGVATAIASGGPGAIFWMWISAFFGMSTIFGEAVLAQKHVDRLDGEKVGGPAYYIRDGLSERGHEGLSKFLAAFFAVSIIIALGFVGNMVQSNSIGVAMNNAFGLKPIVGGIIAAVCGGIIFMGGMGRIASFTQLVVPFMAILYIVGSVVILFKFGPEVRESFKMIFQAAFTSEAVAGGMAGIAVKQAVKYGIARGLFSNEAGMGSTPHAHAVADVDHPAEQGLVAIFGVIFDTLVVCTITALINLATGAWLEVGADGLPITGIEMTQKAYEIAAGSAGQKFIAVSLFFFAFSTIVGWYYFGESNIKYLFGKKGVWPYRIIVIGCILYGSTTSVQAIWEIADLFNGIMVLPNVVGLLILNKEAKAILVDYEDNFLKEHPEAK